MTSIPHCTLLLPLSSITHSQTFDHIASPPGARVEWTRTMQTNPATHPSRLIRLTQTYARNRSSTVSRTHNHHLHQHQRPERSPLGHVRAFSGGRVVAGAGLGGIENGGFNSLGLKKGDKGESGPPPNLFKYLLRPSRNSFHFLNPSHSLSSPHLPTRSRHRHLRRCRLIPLPSPPSLPPPAPIPPHPTLPPLPPPLPSPPLFPLRHLLLLTPNLPPT